MANKSITGIPRASIFSPNHIGNDSAIFNGTADYLREKGYEITFFSEQAVLSSLYHPERVFTMLRNREALKRLRQWETEGCISVNSAIGIENSEREQMTKLLEKHHIPHPKSLIVNTHDYVIPQLEAQKFTSCWIKRGDFHALHREDVTYVRHPEEVQEMLAEYALRDIERVVINEHIEGDLIKFYGVADTPFFHWFYPFNSSHATFGYESINGKTRGIPFQEEELRDLCNRTAETLQLTVYGGDCIVSPDSAIHIIDFNDWPSFASCRKTAIPAIGDAIIKIFGFS